MLTEIEIRKAKPREKVYKLYDGGGLLLRVKPNGSKCWEYKYRIIGESKSTEKTLALGVYDRVSLKEARHKCLEARRLRESGKDPAEVRKAEKRLAKFKVDNDFEGVAKAWFDNVSAKWTPLHGTKLWRRLELHIFPALGKKPISDITALDLLSCLRKAEASDKIHTAQRALQACRSIFQFAVLSQKISYNPAHDLHGVLKAYKEEHYPTIGHNQLPAFLEKLGVVKTTQMNKLAVRLLILTFVRQGELRQARWDDICFEDTEWRVRPETTKMRELHIVPLSRQALAILHELKAISGDSEYLFPSQQKQKHPIMSENTINKVIHNMGYKGMLVGHGFRSMASTILNESGFKPDVIERQLAHMPRDKVRAAYNRAQYLPERKEMMQWWGDYIMKADLSGAIK